MCRNTTVMCCNCIMEGAVDVSQYYCDMLQLHHGGGSGCGAILL